MAESIFDGRYAELVSVECIDKPPFFRTVIIERDSIKGQRNTCLYGTKDEVNSQVCTSPKLLEGKIKNL